MTDAPSADFTGSWSRDGRWIYFGSERSGTKQIWKMPAEGGPAQQVTREGGFHAVEAWDRRHLYYTKENPSGIWRVPVEGGEEIEVLPGPISYFWDWAPSRKGLYFATSRWLVRKSEYTIAFFDFASGEITELHKTEGAFAHSSLAVSPDEEWILYGENPLRNSELMLVENFR